MSTDTPLVRYTRLLEAIAAAPDGLGLTQLAHAAGLQPASAHRLVAALRDIGLLARAEGSRLYLPGPRLKRLCMLAAGPPTLAGIAEPELDELARRHHETAFLARLDGSVVTSVAMATPSDGARTYVQPGRIMPFHASASGKAILAFQDRRFVLRMLAEPLERYTGHTRTDPGEILAELDRVRAAGIAECDNELDPGVLSYAVPVSGPDGAVRHALGICGVSTSLRACPPEEIRASLLRCAGILTAKLQAGLAPAAGA